MFYDDRNGLSYWYVRGATIIVHIRTTNRLTLCGNPAYMMVAHNDEPNICKRCSVGLDLLTRR